MRTLTILAALFLSLSLASAQAHAAPSPAWQHVEQLPPDTAIAVRESSRQYPTSCRIDQANDTTLTCILISPFAPPQTVVYPKAKIAAIYMEEQSFRPGRTGLYLAGTLGAFLGGGLCSRTTVSIALVCASLGGLVGVSAVLHQQPPYPAPPHLVRRLIYAAP